jgi:hypothetical protein
MKWVIAVLWISSVSGLLGGLTNIQRWSSSHGVTHYASLSERMLVLAIGILCAIAAYACAKKKKIGWWLVTVFAAALVCVTAWGVVRIVAVDLSLAVWWLVQIVLMFIFLRWWFRQSKLFSTFEEKA